MASSSIRIPATNATLGPLCALAIFQHFSNLELIKSVHLYMDDSYVTVVQQEFLLSPKFYTQIDEPIPSYFSKFAHNGTKQFIDTLKQLHEADLWQCVLEYNTLMPQDTSIIPLLSVSKNPALYYIPNLAGDLILVERAVQNLVLGHSQCIPLQDSKCLELASPQIFGRCVLGSSWSTSISSMPFTGLLSGSSLISNATAINKSDYTCWSPASLVLESQMAGTYTVHKPLPFSDDNCGGQVELTTSSDASQTAALCYDDMFLDPLCADSTISHRVSPRSPSLKKGLESATSYYSDESVSETAVSLGCPTVAVPLDSHKCRNVHHRDEVLLVQTGSFELTDPGHDVGHIGECISMSMLDKGVDLCNQRGATERMTKITLHELSQYFRMPITQASKELKVGLTVLKKRCREFGIPRWPYRKMKSLDSLIQNIQDLARGPKAQRLRPVTSAVQELKQQKKKMEECPGIELAEQTKRLRQACFKANYKKRCQALTSPQ